MGSSPFHFGADLSQDAHPGCLVWHPACRQEYSVSPQVVNGALLLITRFRVRGKGISTAEERRSHAGSQDVEVVIYENVSGKPPKLPHERDRNVVFFEFTIGRSLPSGLPTVAHRRR